MINIFIILRGPCAFHRYLKDGGQQRGVRMDKWIRSNCWISISTTLVIHYLIWLFIVNCIIVDDLQFLVNVGVYVIIVTFQLFYDTHKHPYFLSNPQHRERYHCRCVTAILFYFIYFFFYFFFISPSFYPFWRLFAESFKAAWKIYCHTKLYL